MADSKNSKISELVELTDPSNADYIPIVDTANEETKKISYTSLVAALNEDDDSYSKTEADALINAVQADVNQNEADADAAIAAVQADVDQNEADADTAIAALQADVDQNESDADAAIAAVQADVDQNEADADAAIAAVQADVNQNEADADAAIAAVQADVDQNESDADAAIALKAPINDPTFTGTVTIPSADITTADFNAGGVGGEVSWNDQEKTLDLVTGADNVTVQLGQEVVLYARNNSGATLSDGNVVMISGSQGNNPTISLAQANTVENARKTIGVVTQIIPNNSNGFVTLIGKVRDLVLDNGTYSEGDVVYLSDTIAGGLTNVEPSISVEVGHVLATSNGGNTNGVLEVQINNGAGTYELEQTLNAAIATNTANIATNTANIAANTSDIADLEDSTESIATVVTGLLPTGTGDNTAKIQAVIDAVAADGGGEIVIPAGVWDIASTIEITTSNIRLRGEGGGWSQDTGTQGEQATTTLNWTGGDGVSTVLTESATMTISNNGTTLTPSSMSGSEHEYQGCFIYSTSGISARDFILDNSTSSFEISPTSNISWGNSTAFMVVIPTAMIEVKSVYAAGSGDNDQQITGSGVSRIHFDATGAAFGLRVIAALNGVYDDLSFIEPTQGAIYMGVKNVDTLNKPAAISQDPQFNIFSRIVSRGFLGGRFGGMLVCTGISDWGSNTSFNTFKDLRAFIKNGDAFVLGSSDANMFDNALVHRKTGGDGEAVLLLGSNVSDSDIPRSNKFHHFGSANGGAIICYGTDTFSYASRNNAFPWLNTENNTPLPTIETGASCYYDTDKGFEFFKKTAGLVVGTNTANMQSARDDYGAESLHITNSAEKHVVLSTTAGDKWRNFLNSTGDFVISRISGTGIIKLFQKVSIGGERKNIRSFADGDVNVQETDNTILLSATTADAKAILPITPTDGDIYTIKCLDATFTARIGKNGNLIEGANTNYTMTLNESLTLQFYDGNWNIIGQS